MTEVRYKIEDLVGDLGITLEDGQKLFDQIHPDLASGKAVELDFRGVRVFASPFFNTGIGQLMRDLSPVEVRQRVKFTNLMTAGRNVLERVLENSGEFYQNEASRAALAAVLDSETKGE